MKNSRNIILIIGLILGCCGPWWILAQGNSDQSNAPLVRAEVEQALQQQPSVFVMIKVKDPGESPHLSRMTTAKDPKEFISKEKIKELQGNLEKDFSEKELQDDLRVQHKLDNVPWITAEITQKALDKLRKNPNVAVIIEEQIMQPGLTESGPLIRANTAYAMGYTGSGVTTAVIDSGIDEGHPDLENDIIGRECFLSGGCPRTGSVRESGPGSVEDNITGDHQGHGTHVAGIITSPQGIAPHAKIVPIKVCSPQGCNLSDIISAIDWVISNREKYSIRIINMSLGGGDYSENCDTQDSFTRVEYEITKAARESGITLFVCSGNDGYTNGMWAPACLSTVISVGSVGDGSGGTIADQVVSSSNVSSSLDLLAPGKWITSSCPEETGSPCTKSGTSMASPHAAALAALMLQKNPALSPSQIALLMYNNGKSITDPRVGLPFKRIDAVNTLDAISWQVLPGPYNFGAVEVGDVSSPRSFIVNNKSQSSNLTINSVTLTAGDTSQFTILNNTCSGRTLTPSSGCSFQVRFAPTSVGNKQATLQVDSNASAPIGAMNISLKGTTLGVALPKTYQTTCYTAAGATTPCPGTGQDGDKLAGKTWPTPRFTTNSDGTITDNLTGLMWLQNGACSGQRTWQGALDWITSLNGGATCSGYTAGKYGDWRLPNINELESLIHAGNASQATWLNGQGFSGVPAAFFWSGTTSAGSTSSAWGINMSDGNMAYNSKSSSYYVLPVRSIPTIPPKIGRTGQTTIYSSKDDGYWQKGVEWPSPRFTDNGNGTVTDNLTNLVWLKHANCLGSQTWQGALNMVANLNTNPGSYSASCNYTATYADWRLPNRKELYSLIDFSRTSPALPLGHPFTNTMTSYWSSTTDAAAPTLGWRAILSTGYITTYAKTSTAAVWPVSSRSSGHDRGGVALPPALTKAIVTVRTQSPATWNMYLGFTTYAEPADLSFKVSLWVNDGSSWSFQWQHVYPSYSSQLTSQIDPTGSAVAGVKPYQITLFDVIQASNNQCSLSSCQTMKWGKAAMIVQVRNQFLCEKYGTASTACNYATVFVPNIGGSNLGNSDSLTPGDYRFIYINK